MHRYLPTVLALMSLSLLAACAQPPVPFVPPDQRIRPSSELPWPEGRVLTLAYHGVEDYEADQTFMSVRTANLIDQFALLREQGYQAVSVDQILAARQPQGKPLPPKAVLLSFDDGYSSFYERVLPILKAYQWPAILAPVGAWMDTPSDQKVNFGGQPVNRRHFTTREQIRAIVDSGLVEIGAHTDNLHFGAPANPQGSMLPAAANRLYLDAQGRYETLAEFRRRLTNDVVRITDKITQVTGKRPRVWVWPYGAANGTALEIVEQQGYQLALTLADGLSDYRSLRNGARILLTNDPGIEEFSANIAAVQKTPMIRVAHVDLDYIYDDDPARMEANLGIVVQRIADLGINRVFLQAFADPDGDGTVRSLYFPNRHLPMRADLFNRTAWQLKTRAGVEVYAWMPVLAFDLDDSLPRVERWNPATGQHDIDPDQYRRLSPFDPHVRQQIGEIYEDLAGHAYFYGLLYHDDALLSDYEDVGEAAMQAYRAAGLPDDIDALRGDPQTLHKWTRFKSRYLIDFTHELTARVHAVRGPVVKTARNIFAQPILNPQSETWFAQNLDDFLSAYDWTAPMAMPLMEGVATGQASEWLAALVREVAKRPGALQRTVFELQTHDWRGGGDTPIDATVIAGWMRDLQRQGVRNFGYYPDDAFTEHPSLDAIRPVMSTAWFPKP